MTQENSDMEGDIPEAWKLVLQQQEQNRAEFRAKDLSHEELVAAYMKQSKSLALLKAEIKSKDNQIKTLETEIAELRAKGS
ncbi:hypothetical protein [Phormidesmis sp. 146-33]